MFTKGEEIQGILCAELWFCDVSFHKKCAKFRDTRNTEILMPYKELVVAYLEVGDERTGMATHPELAEITEALEGSLILYDREYRRIQLRSVRADVRAGAVLKQLAIHAPYLFFEYMPWMDQGDPDEFSRIREMVSVMRAVF